MVLRIAVADDERDMRDYLAKILPRLGHQVVAVAENGQRLVDLCSQTRPDLVITDIRMPGMDGLEAAKEIDRLRPTPVIFVSAHLDEQQRVQSVGQASRAFLMKPIKQADLAAALAAVDHEVHDHPDGE